MTAAIHYLPNANAFGIVAAHLDRTTAPEAVRPAPRRVTLSDLIADARAALACPKGAPAAELAGHLMLLEVYGNEDEQAYARDFAEDMRHRDDLALWLDVVMVPPKRDALPKIAAPMPEPSIFAALRKHGIALVLVGGMAALAVGWAVLTGVLA